jgi:hypothetical protein
MRNCFIILLFTFSINAQQFSKTAFSAILNMHSNYGNAVADYDLDGDLDVFIVAYKPFNQNDPTTWSRLLKNINGRLENATAEAGFGNQNPNTSNPYVKLGASWGDYNNDGYPDLLLAHQNSTQLYRNMGNGTFIDVTDSANIISCSTCSNSSGLWWDYDNDGDLDLYLNYLEVPNRLYNNQGDGTFEEIEGALNLNDPSRTWSCLPIDANRDGWMDIYVVNDFGLSKFYINQEGKSFVNATTEYNLENKGCGMGSTIGDFNNDGYFDIYVTNIAESKSNPLFMGTAAGPFINRTIDEGVGNGHFGWGTKFIDADNDGYQDIYIVNGDNDLHYNNVFFKNMRSEGMNRFEAWSEQSHANGNANGMSTEVFDYDNDGDLDILVSNTSNSPYLYKNENVSPNAWLQINLEGTHVNRNAFGTEITAFTKDKSVHRLHHGASIMGQSIKPIHMGLGITKKIDSLSVKWPNGNHKIIYDVAINQKIKILESQGMVEGNLFTAEQVEIIENPIPEVSVNMKVSTIPNPFNESTEFHINIKTPGLLSLQIYSILGIKVYDFEQQILTQGDWYKSWNAKDKNEKNLTSGMYLFKINIDNTTFNGKLLFNN